MVEKKEGCCCCGGNCDNETMKAAEEKRGQGAAVKILGGGCARCDALESATVQALGELGLETAVDHVKDYAEIASYGVMSTPALVFNGKVLSYGKVLKSEEVKALLQKEMN